MIEIYKIFENRSLYDKVMILIGSGVFIMMVVNFSLFIYKRLLKKKKPKDLSNVPYIDWPWMGGDPHPDKAPLIDPKSYKRETYEQVTKRYNGFGEELYTLIQQRLPDVFKHLKFYRLKESVTDEDSLAVYKKGKIHFFICLSYHDHISVSNKEDYMEFGFWDEEHYENVLKFIAELAGADLQPKLSS